MTPRQANLVTAAGLVAFMGVVAGTAPRWAAALRQPTAWEADEPGAPASAAPSEPAASAERRIHVRLYFEAAESEGLLAEEREITFSSDIAVQLRTVVEELAKGPTSDGLLATLPPGTQVLEVFVHPSGVAYVDLSKEVRAGLAGGARAEMLTVYSLVNTIASNFPAASRVRILVDDRAVPSLAGHVDLSRPLAANMSLLARPSPPAEPAQPSSPAQPH